jgi:hypothetical protein
MFLMVQVDCDSAKYRQDFFSKQSMTPEEQKRLQACINEIAQILYNNTPKAELTTLEAIEKAVRQQMMEHVSPKIALFLSKK